MSATIRPLNLSNEGLVSELLALQKASYAVEAALIGSTAIPPLHDAPHTLARCGETFHGFFHDGKLAAAISYKRLGDTVDIHRLVVHPDHFRRGMGRALVRHVETVEGSADKMVVSTGAANLPAIRLYLSLGFEETGEAEAAPSLVVVDFEKRLGGVAQKRDRGLPRRSRDERI